MKGKHTKGQWSATITPSGRSKVVDSNGFSICNTPYSTDQDSANAKLIAAAPTMLEAIKYAMNKIYTLENTENGVRDDIRVDLLKMKDTLQSALTAALGN